MIAPAPLVTALTYSLAADLMRAAYAALSRAECRRVERIVTRLVAIGRLDTARTYVADSIRANSLEAEIRRHALDCPICSAGEMGCYVLADMERRADAVGRLTARAERV